MRPEAGADRLAHAFLVDDGEHAGHGRVDQRDVALGAPPNSVEAPENSLELDETCAWTSMPITTSQELVAPSMRLCCLVSAVMAASLVPYTLPLPSQTPWPPESAAPHISNVINLEKLERGTFAKWLPCLGSNLLRPCHHDLIKYYLTSENFALPLTLRRPDFDAASNHRLPQPVIPAQAGIQ